MTSSGQPPKPAPVNIYHEKQVKAFCALHAINNVLQEGRFTKRDLDTICNQLDPNSWWWNEHRSFLGIGNFDVNVIMSALEKCEKELVWFDKRKDPEDVLNSHNIYGFILNIRTDIRYKTWWLTNFMKKHWIVVKGFNGDYYEIDSKRNDPELLGKERDLYAHLRHQLGLPETELFLVLEKPVAAAQSWKRKESEESVRQSMQEIDKELNVVDLNNQDVKT